MTGAVQIRQALPLEPYRIEVAWADGRKDRIDLEAWFRRHAVFTALLGEAERFRGLIVDEWGWSIGWRGLPDAEIPAQRLRQLALVQRGESIEPEALRAWRRGHGLTQQAAAEALGLSRRTVIAYERGEQSIPKTVVLALHGYDATTAPRQARG